MALAEDPNLRRRERLPVIAILVLVALMTLVGGVLAAGSSPSSQIPVLVLEQGWFTAFAAPRGVLADVGSDAARKGQTLADTSGAFVYRDGAFTALSSIPGAAFSTHVANNNRGQIAGFYSAVLPGPDGTVPPGTRTVSCESDAASPRSTFPTRRSSLSKASTTAASWWENTAVRMPFPGPTA